MGELKQTEFSFDSLPEVCVKLRKKSRLLLSGYEVHETSGYQATDDDLPMIFFEEPGPEGSKQK